MHNLLILTYIWICYGKVYTHIPLVGTSIQPVTSVITSSKFTGQLMGNESLTSRFTPYKRHSYDVGRNNQFLPETNVLHFRYFKLIQIATARHLTYSLIYFHVARLKSLPIHGIQDHVYGWNCCMAVATVRFCYLSLLSTCTSKPTSYTIPK